MTRGPRPKPPASTHPLQREREEVIAFLKTRGWEVRQATRATKHGVVSYYIRPPQIRKGAHIDASVITWNWAMWELASHEGGRLALAMLTAARAAFDEWRTKP